VTRVRSPELPGRLSVSRYGFFKKYICHNRAWGRLVFTVWRFPQASKRLGHSITRQSRRLMVVNYRISLRINNPPGRDFKLILFAGHRRRPFAGAQKMEMLSKGEVAITGARMLR